MPVITTYGIAGKDSGILALAFPGVRVLKGPPFWPFIADKRLIVFSEDDPFTKYPEKEIIQIKRDAPIQLDTRRGFLRFLGSIGVKASDFQVEALLKMELQDFWYEAKIATILKSFPNLAEGETRKRKGAVYRMYAALFDDFPAVWVEYDLLKETMSFVEMLAALMTMAQTARVAHRRGGMNEYYRKILLKNRQFEPIFNRELLRYLRSRKDEWCFLGFLANCSRHSRPEVWPPPVNW